MNEHFRPGPFRTARVCSIVAVCGALAACANPFATTDEDRGEAVAPERLRIIDPFRVEGVGKPLRRVEDAIGSLTAPPDLFAGVEKVPVSLEEARAQTLRHNLNLQVALVDPTIAQQRVSEEEARFEAVLFTNARITKLDQPVASSLAGSNVEQYDVTPGVRIPLRTGGTATIELPIDRTSTDNQFTDPAFRTSYTSDLRLSISQPLLRSAGRRAATFPIRIQALESQVAQAQAKLEVIRRLAEADSAYWTLYATQQLLEVRQAQFELAQEQLERAERRVRANTAPEIEIVRAQTGVSERLEQIILSQNEVRRALRRLKLVMNIPGLDVNSEKTIALLTQPDPVEFELDRSALAAAAIANRMEMLQLELRLAQDFSTIEFQKNQALPLFTFDYSYTVNGLGSSINRSVDLLNDNRFTDWSLGLNFEVPLGNEAAESRVHQAILRRLQRLASRDAQRQSIEQEVLDAVDTLDASWQRILAARQSAILAARTLAGEQRQFEVGTRTSTDVLDAAARLADAQSNEIRALAAYQISQVDLAFATGTLLGASKVDWEPRDPRGPEDHFGERITPTTPPPGTHDPDGWHRGGAGYLKPRAEDAVPPEGATAEPAPTEIEPVPPAAEPPPAPSEPPQR